MVQRAKIAVKTCMCHLMNSNGIPQTWWGYVIILYRMTLSNRCHRRLFVLIEATKTCHAFLPNKESRVVYN